jgi:hypothetical protein
MTLKVGKRLICLLFFAFQTLVNRLGGRRGEGGGSRAKKGGGERGRGKQEGETVHF